MCLEAAEEFCPKTVLDLGCGSGILAIAALLMGAEKAVCCDIDEKARKVVMENAALNGIGADARTVYSGDIVGDERIYRKTAGKYLSLIHISRACFRAAYAMADTTESVSGF